MSRHPCHVAATAVSRVRRTGRWAALGAFCGMLVVLFPAGEGVARAQTDGSEVEKLSADAFAKYHQGDYRGAVALYLRAYETQPVAALLYNLAKIYDGKLQDRELAIEYYRKYIASTGADPKLVETAASRVRELRVQQDAARMATEGQTEARPEPPPTATPAPDSTPSQPSPEPRRNTGKPESTPADGGGDGRTMRTVGYVIGGVGAACIGFGSVAGLVAKFKDGDADNHCNGDNYCDQTGLDQTDSAKTWAGVATGTWVAGGLFVTAGVLMVVLARSEPEAGSPPAVAVGPTLRDGAGGLVLKGVW
ncbi:tol-pal system YbgF family protein [Myxococcota bacterium]